MFNANFVVIVVFILLMFWLFGKDYKSDKKGGTHKDYASIIISTGVLGTFVGIFLGLLGFDSENISSSVPRLLDGLKTAFITSIVGMSLAILLSIIQKRKGGGAEGEKELLESINTNIFSIKEELLPENKESLFEFLKDELPKINTNLQEAVNALAEGATEEIIKALEKVIQDFNNNLTQQFGDNFTQLNEAVLAMIEWQASYRNSVQEFEKSLQSTIEQMNSFSSATQDSLKESVEQNLAANEQIQANLKELFKKMNDAVLTTAGNAKQIIEITQNYAKIPDITAKLESVITTNQNQIENLETHLNSLAEVGQNAQGITEGLENFSTKVQGAITNQAQALTALTQEIETQLPSSLGKLNESLTSLTNQFAKDYESFLEQVSKLMKANNNN